MSLHPKRFLFAVVPALLAVVCFPLKGGGGGGGGGSNPLSLSITCLANQPTPW